MRISDWSSDVCSSDLLTGQSYGGLETAFIITQTDIFKAAVAVDLDSDLLAAALQTYGHYDGPPASMSSALAQTNQFYMTRAPWDDPETYIRNSAIHYARNVETPLLIRQNDHDEETPFFQGVKYFRSDERRVGKEGVRTGGAR